ncbi:hypothetical protein M0812_15995 [Anaeramoeba flamelloides]|uniref:Uncharacterized protein n=1 Tax=Anaeramoeba flamelloides TaxID=1746091 RepID=A0AAV7ZHQ2_9EUKA|nr:hypothetical protein M0812_15995 [Anaeramoeba flamelloides]
MKLLFLLVLIIFVSAQNTEQSNVSIKDFPLGCHHNNWVYYAVSSVYSDLYCQDSKTTVPLLLNHCLSRPHGMPIDLFMVNTNHTNIDMYFCTLGTDCTQCQLGKVQPLNICYPSDEPGEIWSENFELKRKRKNHLKYVEKHIYGTNTACEGDFSSDAVVINQCYQKGGEYSYKIKYNCCQDYFIYKVYSDLECDDWESSTMIQGETCFEQDGVYQEWVYGFY